MKENVPRNWYYFRKSKEATGTKVKWWCTNGEAARDKGKQQPDDPKL